MLHRKLYSDPLVIGQIKGLRDSFIVVLAGEEEDATRVASHQVQHEHTVQLEHVAIFDGRLCRLRSHASCLVHLNGHGPGVRILVLLQVGELDLSQFQLTTIIGLAVVAVDAV